MPILSNKLRHRVTFEELLHEQDQETGDVSDIWAPLLFNVPVDIVPLSGRELLAAQSLQAGVTTRIVARYPLPGVAPSTRIRHGQEYYNIKAILPDRTLRGHLSLMCERGVVDSSIEGALTYNGSFSFDGTQTFDGTA